MSKPSQLKKHIFDVQKISKLGTSIVHTDMYSLAIKSFTVAMHMTEKNESAVEHYGQADWR